MLVTRGWRRQCGGDGRRHGRQAFCVQRRALQVGDRGFIAAAPIGGVMSCLYNGEHLIEVLSCNGDMRSCEI